MFEIILWEVSLKNKRGRLFFKRLFVPQASQSSHDRRAEPDVLLAVPPARSACGMGGYDERSAFTPPPSTALSDVFPSQPASLTFCSIKNRHPFPNDDFSSTIFFKQPSKT